MNKIEELFESYYNPLCNYAAKIVKDNAYAEDIVQSLFIQLWEKDKFINIQNAERFLLRSTKFKCIDFIRKQQRVMEIPLNTQEDYFQESHLDLDESDIVPLLHFFASKLPPKTRTVFLLSRKSGLSYAEIAEEENIAIKTVEAHMTKALKSMRILLKEHDYFCFLAFINSF